MIVLSLFDGISTGRLALQNLGIKVDRYYASEVDKIAIATSKSNWDDITQIGDVTQITKKQLQEINPDLILAGSPCQGFSRQGSQLDFKDPRSKLFFVFLRILKYVKSYVNPEVKFLFENVKMKNICKDTITELLGVTPVEINSKDYSAQSRPRLYWTNISIELPKPYQIELKSILEPAHCKWQKDRSFLFDVDYKEKHREIVFENDKGVFVKQATKSGVIRISNFSGVNLCMPGNSSKRGRVIHHKSHCIDTGGDIGVYYNHKFRRFSCTELERLQTLPDGYTQFRVESSGEVIENTHRQRIALIGNGWTTSVIEILLSNFSSRK